MRDATHATSTLHGEQHWRAVADAGVEIALHGGGCPKLALAFGMIHDCQRLNDDWDPLHGTRAARWAKRSRHAKNLLGADSLALLVKACDGHDGGRTTKSAAIGACWDADRINLWRVGIEPDNKFFSVLRGEKFNEMKGRYRTGWSTPPEWDEIIAKALQSA